MVGKETGEPLEMHKRKALLPIAQHFLVPNTQLQEMPKPVCKGARPTASRAGTYLQLREMRDFPKLQ